MAKSAIICSLLCLTLAAPALGADLKEDLWTASRTGDAKAVEALLAKGVDVNAKTHYGATALWFAAYKGHLEVVKVLLKNKADLNASDTIWGSSPLSLALGEGRVEIVKVLLEAGAAGADAALLDSVSQGNVAIVRAVLDKSKVSVDSLMAALVIAPVNKPEIVPLLKKAGAKPLPKADASTDTKSLTEYVGSYQSLSGRQYKVALREGRLTVGFPAQDLYLLKAADDAAFTAVGYENISFAFARENGKITKFTMKLGSDEALFLRMDAESGVGVKPRTIEDAPAVVRFPLNWPSFRGSHASGVADGQHPPTTWDVAKGRNVRWKTPIPGLAHSSPIVWGHRVFLTTAVSGDPKSEFRPGLYGAGTSAGDVSPHSWRVYCVDTGDGKILWEKTAHQGVPKIKRHIKSSHANPTPATDGKHLVAYFASEGLYCYDLDGKPLWKQDIGLIDVGAFNDPDLQWGVASSPIIYRNLVIVQCDRHKDSFIAAYDLDSGKRVWLTTRDEIPSWSTPTIYEGKARDELIANGTKYVRGYEPLTGKELWRLGRNSEITVPAPIIGHGLIFVTSGYRPIQPIYAIWPGAAGDVSLPDSAESNLSVAWSKKRGGPYMPTPIVYGDYLYTCANSGIVTCYEAKTGKQVHQKRLGGTGGFSASPVAADGRLYFTSEEGDVRVVKAGPNFELLAVNPMGDVCMATPAISDGMLFVRSQHYLFGVGRTDTQRSATH
jgi:outer membrane protein assembly factor BamB/ankyrin repeat protein